MPVRVKESAPLPPVRLPTPWTVRPPTSTWLAALSVNAWPALLPISVLFVPVLPSLPTSVVIPLELPTTTVAPLPTEPSARRRFSTPVRAGSTSTPRAGVTSCPEAITRTRSRKPLASSWSMTKGNVAS